MRAASVVVTGLSKRYRIGLEEAAPDTLVGTLASWVSFPIKNFKQLRSLSRFDEESDDTVWALRDVSFEVGRGEVLGVIGRNGAGKSTLLKILSRITEPTAGRAVINGRVSSLLEVGTGFHPELTGRENVYLNGTVLGMTKREIDVKFDEIVDFSGVGKYLETPVKRYSSGMKVRLAFSVAAHLEPEVLLIDEVLAVGDASFQKRCLGKMNEIAGEGRTVVFVSHDMDAVCQLCESVMLIDGGRIVLRDGPRVTIDRYMALGQGEEGLLEEDPDSTLDAQVLRVSVGTRGAAVQPTVSADEEVVFRFEYEFREPLPEAYVVVRVTSLSGRVVFSTTDSDVAGPLNRRARGVGRFSGSFAIPRRFLWPGTYSFITGILVPHGRLIHRIRLPYYFTITPGDTTREHDPESWRASGGLVRLDVPWEAQAVPEVVGEWSDDGAVR